MSKTYDTFDVAVHGKDHFSAQLSLKHIAMGAGISLGGLLLMGIGPNMHTRSGRWFLLLSIGLIIGGAVFAYIMRHTHLFTATGEKLDLWFRYFESNQKEALLKIFDSENWHELQNLNYALDEGENDNSDASGNSSLMIQADGVASGGFLTVQVIEYIDRAPEGITPLKTFTGEMGRKVYEHFAAIHQGT